MGSLRWRTGDKMEPGRADNDALDRTALYRPAWTSLGCADRLGCRWRIYPAISLVDYGWPIRGAIPKCLVVARCRLWRAQPAVAGLRPDVLLRDALQRRERGRGQDDVLCSLQIRASLEVSD